ncbi:MAG: hypothetical protein J5699_03290 [Bacteroidales bacterium]|nr:hypothetical protein [Bacteroidales bacterium]
MQTSFQKRFKIFSLKSASIVAVLVMLLGGCCSNKESIRQKAKKHECSSELNSIVDFYSRCNYALPSSISDITDFLNEWKKQDSTSYDYFDDSGNDYVDILKKNRLRFAYYGDSIFIYSPRKRVGCCVYGHPLFWINNPESYLEHKLIYEPSPAVFNSKGQYIFNFQYAQLARLIDSISANYSKVYLYKKKLYPTERKRFFPVKAIVEYYPMCDSTSFHFPVYDTIYYADSIDYNNSFTTAVPQKVVSRISDSDFFRDVACYLKVYSNNTDLSKIILPIIVYDN